MLPRTGLSVSVLLAVAALSVQASPAATLGREPKRDEIEDRLRGLAEGEYLPALATGFCSVGDDHFIENSSFVSEILEDGNVYAKIVKRGASFSALIVAGKDVTTVDEAAPLLRFFFTNRECPTIHGISEIGAVNIDRLEVIDEGSTYYLRLRPFKPH
ncbi:hypothetical protein [Stappia indica]|uniref:hypothetical protein n=1 Tax=Stappia indica TaxID=538381 RepID=UPI001CD2DE2A|nr:hypothetical protein [Stappia indica]MCA1299627.1 hypothetical protein [Stappia indica]